MALFSNLPPASGQVGVNHADGVTGGIACVRTRERLRAMPLISLKFLFLSCFPNFIQWIEAAY
jgi:hypothetical protein